MILDHGPLKKFSMLLGEIRAKFTDNCPIRTYLVTARSAASSGLRALRTLREWGLDIDEALFLAGAPKGPILEKIRPHLFFDDQQRNIDSGLQHGVNAAYVPYGVARKLDRKQEGGMQEGGNQEGGNQEGVKQGSGMQVGGKQVGGNQGVKQGGGKKEGGKQEGGKQGGGKKVGGK